MNATSGSIVVALATSVEGLSALTQAYALEPALSDSVLEDIKLIRSQVVRARDTVAALAENPDLQSQEHLHRLNNALTGIISLATLCAEDVAGFPRLASQLDETRRLARLSAQAIRELGGAG